MKRNTRKNSPADNYFGKRVTVGDLISLLKGYPEYTVLQFERMDVSGDLLLADIYTYGFDERDSTIVTFGFTKDKRT